MQKGYVPLFLAGTVAVMATGVAVFSASLASISGPKATYYSANALTGSQRIERPVVSPISQFCEGKTPKTLISWNAVPGASSYSISRLSPKKSGWPQIAKTASTTYIDASFASVPGTYKYQVMATIGSRRTYSDIQTVYVASCAQNSGGVVATSTATTTKPVTPPVVVYPASNTPPVTTNPTTPATPTSPVVQPTGGPVFSKKEWGVYVGWQESAMAEFISKTGTNPQYQAVFVHWGNENEFPVYLSQSLKDSGRTLIIFWEATDYENTSVNQPAYNYDSVIAGKWDSYFREFAAEAKSYGSPVIMIPFSEMNGNWFPFGGMVNGNTPAKHILAFRHIREFFRDAPNVKFGWAPNSDSLPDTPENQLEKYYPGDQYVDYVGVDGFNFNTPWMTFDQVFGSALTRLQAYKKPIFVFSFASAQGTKKAAWITDALTVQMKRYPSIKAWIWFNENKEKDWRVWSDAASLAAFKAGIQ